MCQVFLRCAALLLIIVSGCATWHSDKPPSQSRGLPAPRRHPGGALLEVAFVSIQPTSRPQAVPATTSRRSAESSRKAMSSEESDTASASDQDATVGDELGIDPNSQPAHPFQSAFDVAAVAGHGTVAAHSEPEDIWNWIDETVIAPEVRHALRRNGLRIGKAQRVGDFSERLNRIRRQGDQSSRVLEVAEVESDLSHQSRKITCRIGKRYELPVRQPAAGEQAVLVTLGGQTLGKTLSQAQPLFALRANTADVNSIKLSLRPEIQHGALRQAWVGSDAALRIDNRRDAWTFDELVTEIRLEKGGILVAGCIDPPFGLGQHMFTGTTAEGDADQVLMIIRVADLPELIDP
jgi:hypothetical protein